MRFGLVELRAHEAGVSRCDGIIGGAAVRDDQRACRAANGCGTYAHTTKKFIHQVKHSFRIPAKTTTSGIKVPTYYTQVYLDVERMTGDEISIAKTEERTHEEWLDFIDTCWFAWEVRSRRPEGAGNSGAAEDGGSVGEDMEVDLVKQEMGETDPLNFRGGSTSTRSPFLSPLPTSTERNLPWTRHYRRTRLSPTPDSPSKFSR